MHLLLAFSTASSVLSNSVSYHRVVCNSKPADTVQTRCRHCADTVQTRCRHGADTVETRCRHCADTMQTLCRHGACMVQPPVLNSYHDITVTEVLNYQTDSLQHNAEIVPQKKPRQLNSISLMLNHHTSMYPPISTNVWYTLQVETTPLSKLGIGQ